MDLFREQMNSDHLPILKSSVIALTRFQEFSRRFALVPSCTFPARRVFGRIFLRADAPARTVFFRPRAVFCFRVVVRGAHGVGNPLAGAFGKTDGAGVEKKSKKK
jgi:hypothetical protein